MIKLFISVDIGNSFTSIATFVNDKIFKVESFKTDDEIEFEVSDFLEDIEIEKYEISGLISSVVPKYTFYVARAILEKTNVLVRVINDGITPELKINGDVDVSEIGGDLVSDIYAAKKDYGYPCVIVDVGTVTKILVIDEKGAFTGATFAPGLHLALSSMVSGTALLNNKEEKFTKEPIGKNTVGCMLSGVTTQIIGGIKETIKPYEKMGYRMILTGGYGRDIKSFLPKSFTLDEHLTIKGVKYIYESIK